jgi:MerR family copper efflux transcriptional regulator
MNAYTIGQVASRADIAVDTIRYYERAGLIPPPARRASGYREYPADTVARLRFIRRAKSLGFTLSEIAELFELTQRNHANVHGVKAAAAAKLQLVESKLDELQRIRSALQQLLVSCPGQGDLADCPIVKALNEDAPEVMS